MKRITWVIICNILLINTSFSSQVDTTYAKKVAKNFYLSRILSSNQTQLKSFSTQDFYLQLVHQEFDDSPDSASLKTSNNQPLYYIFNINNKGFIIVSADDEVKPILGYSYTCQFSPEDQPPAYIAWMKRYKEQIKYLKKNTLKYTSTVLDEWTKYSGSIIAESDTRLSEVVPLLSTTWEQGCYYNQYCPIDYRGPCNKVWAGCGATAMGQIMKFWEYPNASSSIPGYLDGINYDDDGNPISNTNYSINNVSKSSYNWSIMPDSLNLGSSEIQKAEVSKLLYHCGVGSKINYGPTGSGTTSPEVIDAFTSYFNYASSSELIEKTNYDDTVWKNMLKNELDKKRPIYYQAGIHACVCDGYQGSDYFHFNWGWGGYCDGYFYLDDLTPGYADFTYPQTAIIGIHPDTPTNYSIKIFEKTRITISPNPTSNKIHLKPNSDIDTEISILLFDYSGRLVYTKSLHKLLSNESFEIDISSFKYGIYILQLNNLKSKIIERVIKQ